MENHNAKCPFCGADLQENASFCLHCMRSLDEKTEIKKENATKGRKLGIIIAAAVILIAAVVCVFIVCTSQRKANDEPYADTQDTKDTEESAAQKDYDSIVTTPIEFCLEAALASDKLGYGELWSPYDFKETAASKDMKKAKWRAPVAIPDSVLSVYFFNGGETVDFILADVPEEYLDDAKKIAICAVDGACNNYFTDIEDIFFEEKAYPKEKYGVPFEEYFTDLENRTETYNSDIANGCVISTDYLPVNTETGHFIEYFLTCRNNGESVLYDLCLHFERFE